MATEQDDIIVLPFDYRMNAKLLDAGDGDDILISTGGNVTLAAGKGNNIIFINQLHGYVTIILQDKRIADYQIVDHNGNRSYVSADGLSGILIEDYDQQNVIINAAIGQGETLNNRQLDSLIDFIAAFDSNGENGRINLMTYLPNFNIDLDFSVATTI